MGRLTSKTSQVDVFLELGVRKGVGLANLKSTPSCRRRQVSTQERLLKKRGSDVLQSESE